MAPNTKCVPNTRKKLSRVFAESGGDEIVISGMSGRFPSSRNVAEFEQNLFNKTDMVKNWARWTQYSMNIPDRYGTIYDLDKFDAMFFGVHFKQTISMDPQCRVLLECAYEAIMDAGVNPRTLRGTRTGVFIGGTLAESDKTMFYERSTGFGITGSSRAMLANRVSYVLGFNGPSFFIDATESSSSHCLDIAFTAIRNGEIDAAIVGGTNLILHPYVVSNFASLGILSPDGCSRPFDKDCNGYARAEAIPCIFLQRKKEAARAYATVVYSKVNHDGYKEQGITYPASLMKEELLHDFYKELNFDVNNIGYIEAHCTGSVVADVEECRAIEKAICNKRNGPLLIGSVRSNMGNSEPSSGICSIIKTLFAFQKGKIAPNINFKNLRTDIPALTEGKLKVVDEVTDLLTPYAAINSFGFSGVNSHILLRRFEKKKENFGIPKDSLARLVLWSGRTQESINNVFSLIEQKPLDSELVALINNFNSAPEPVPGFVFRGYGLYNQMEDKNAICLVKDVTHFTGIRKPVVWVFSGMGSQWPEMGKALMNIPVFKEAILECHEILKPKGLDLLEILTSKELSTFDNILHSFVGIAAIQIGIIDVLRTLDLSPDYIIGHSVGELGCAYADNAFTAEQMILSAYYRGKVSLETEKIRGSMAAIGLGYNRIISKLPPTIDVACHNSDTSCTISGPADEVNKFVEDLKSNGVFAREVPCSNIAYHSRYISHMGPTLLQYLQEIIPNPKQRSSKWLSTSVPKAKWDLPESNLSSAEYYTNNLLSSVLFEETTKLLPDDCLTIEIAPHALLQAIIKKSMPKAIHIGLTQRNNPNNDQHFLTALGKLFINGEELPINRIYPPVDFPVSLETPFISPTIGWDHKVDWFTMKFKDSFTGFFGERRYNMELSSKDYEYIKNNVFDGRTIIPCGLYFKWLWDLFAIMQSDNGGTEGDAIEFLDIRIERSIQIIPHNPLFFIVKIHTGTGMFEITVDDIIVVSGTIRGIGTFKPVIPKRIELDNPVILQSKCFYKEMRLKGYQFQNPFRDVLEARIDGLEGKIRWSDNWISFMEALLQLILFRQNSKSLLLPVRIDKISIDFKDHMDILSNSTDKVAALEVLVDNDFDRTVCGGIEIVGLHTEELPRIKQFGTIVLERQQFLANVPTPILSKSNAVKVCIQIALENSLISNFKIVEVDLGQTKPIVQYFNQVFRDLPLVTGTLIFLSQQKIDPVGVHVENGKISSLSNCTIVIASRLLSRTQSLNLCQSSLHQSGYIISREARSTNLEDIKSPPNYNIITVIPVEDEVFVVMQRARQVDLKQGTTVTILESDKNYDWIKKIQDGMRNGPVFVVSYNDKFSGLVGIINSLRKETNGHLVQGVIINDKNAPKFDITLPVYKNQLKMGFAINIYKNGNWGTYKNLELAPEFSEIPQSGHVYKIINSDKNSFNSSWLKGPLIETERQVKVVYASVQFEHTDSTSQNVSDSDVLTVTRKSVAGLEFSGIDKHGTMYMGLVPNADVTSHIQLNPNLVFQVPSAWNLAEAATMPLSYITVYWSFFFVGNIRKSKSILIHCGCSAIGQAAIRVALAYGLDVYTTVSSEEKKAFLLQTFNKLNVNHIGFSRDGSFEDMIKIQTDGKGVDLVLNFLPHDQLVISLRCLSQNGICVHIGKTDLVQNQKIGLRIFLNELSLQVVLIDKLFAAPSNKINELKTMITHDISKGIIKPLPYTVFKPNELQQAYRHLSSTPYIGKALIQVFSEPKSPVTLPLIAKAQIYFNPNLVYVISEGLGDFGLQFVQWMIDRNAKKFVLHSSCGLSNSYQAYRVRQWKNNGLAIHMHTGDISTQRGCESLLKKSSEFGVVGGIIANHINEDFTSSLLSKAIATIYLDELSRKLCSHLQHFIVLCNTICDKGKEVQTTLGVANSIMQTIVEDRAESGLPAKAIKWGALCEIGCGDDGDNDKLQTSIRGYLRQQFASCFDEVDNLIVAPDPIVSCQVLTKKYSNTGGKKNIVETIMGIVDYRDFKLLSTNTPISNVSLDLNAIHKIKEMLEKEFEISLTTEDLNALNLQKIVDMCQKKQTEDTGIVEIRMANEDKPRFDEILLWASLGDEYNINRSVLPLTESHGVINNSCLIIPGFEGVTSGTWNKLAVHVRSHCFVLQLMSSIKMTNVEDIASNFSRDAQLQVFNRVNEPFYIIGYSFGAIIALELAKILEETGLKGNLLLIDGAPAYLKRLCLEYLGHNANDEAIQLLLLASLVKQLVPNEASDKTNEHFKKLSSWPRRLECLSTLLQKQNVYSTDYALKMANALYNRIKLVMETTIDTDIKKKISANITLVRPAQVSVIDIEQDYELSKYTTGKINVKYIEGNHVTILENPKLTKIINDSDPAVSANKEFYEYICG